MPASPDDTTSREITATRVVDAPRELVFRVWTAPSLQQTLGRLADYVAKS